METLKTAEVDGAIAPDLPQPVDHRKADDSYLSKFITPELAEAKKTKCHIK